MQMKALTSFYFQQEMWRKGEIKDVIPHYATTLKQGKLVIEATKEEILGAAKAPEIQPSFETENNIAFRKRETKPAKLKLEKK